VESIARMSESERADLLSKARKPANTGDTI
jgi:hypothetical protein